MPRVKSVPSLLKLCFKRIKMCIECCEMFFDPLAGRSQARRVNPFEKFPTHLLDEIIKYLPKIEYPTPYQVILYRLASPQIRHLDLVPSSNFHELTMFRFKNLVSLSLHGIQVTDRFLSTVGFFCNNLKKLDVSDCPHVTDAGIRSLIVNKLDRIFKKAIFQTLEKLMIYNTGVTETGAKMALHIFPALKILQHETTFKILVNLAEESSSQIPKFSICCLFIKEISRYGNGGLGLVVSVCPSLTCIVIDSIWDLRDKDLLSLIPLQLRELRISNSHTPMAYEVGFTFDGGVAPLLKKVGGSLVILDIIFFDLVNIWTIVKLCPNLISLSLIDHRIYRESSPEIGLNVFPAISEYSSLMKLNICQGHDLKPEVLFFLLSSPSLKIISITNCPALTDDILQNLVKCHGLQNLKELRLERCDSLTKEGVDALMTQHNSLKSINFCSCKLLTQNDISVWDEQTRKNNWKLNLFFK